jgi:sulfate adenylyltransferase subunit 2
VRSLTHLDRLEAESIHILRETVAEADRPVMLYSIGKDSAVMLHLAKKAFFPSPLPFPLLHVDTTWKFKDMYALRDKVAADPAIKLIVYKNPEAEIKGINPFDHGPVHTDMWKTEGLKQALDKFGFDAAFGGARRDVPLYFAAERPTVERDGLILMVDDDRFPLDGDKPENRKVRFRTLGCYPLSGAVESDAETVEQIVAEMLLTQTSERQGRAIDRDAGSASMERKKQEGYF